MCEELRDMQINMCTKFERTSDYTIEHMCQTGGPRSLKF